jgi:hypothetical protein
LVNSITNVTTVTLVTEIVKMTVHVALHVECLILSGFKSNWNASTNFNENHMNFNADPPFVSSLIFLRGRTDGQTDMTEVIVAVRKMLCERACELALLLNFC